MSKIIDFRAPQKPKCLVFDVSNNRLLGRTISYLTVIKFWRTVSEDSSFLQEVFPADYLHSQIFTANIALCASVVLPTTQTYTFFNKIQQTQAVHFLLFCSKKSLKFFNLVFIVLALFASIERFSDFPAYSQILLRQP